MDYIFFQVAGINGFDSFGHYLRAALIVNACTNYVTTPVFGCSANFRQASAASAGAQAASAASGPRDPVLRRTAIALAKSLGLPVPEGEERPEKARKPRRKAERRVPEPATVQPEPSGTPAPQPEPAPDAAPPAQDAPTQTETLLDYLFGGDE